MWWPIHIHLIWSDRWDVWPNICMWDGTSSRAMMLLPSLDVNIDLNCHLARIHQFHSVILFDNIALIHHFRTFFLSLYLSLFKLLSTCSYSQAISSDRETKDACQLSIVFGTSKYNFIQLNAIIEHILWWDLIQIVRSNVQCNNWVI